MQLIKTIRSDTMYLIFGFVAVFCCGNYKVFYYEVAVKLKTMQ